MTLKKKLIFVAFLYFAEGFPYGVIQEVLPVYFRLHGMSLEYVGFLSVLALPYAVKVLWAPAVDFLGTRRRWIAGTQAVMAVLLAMILFFNPADPSMGLWILLMCLAVFSATQDIAIDAYTIEMLNTSEMGIANGVRQAAYRAAILLTGGILVAAAGFIGWRSIYFIAAGALAVCSLCAFYLPDVGVARPSFSAKTLLEPVRDFARRPGVVQIILFILFFKLGDFAIGPMIRPFWLDRGMSVTEIGLVTGLLGVLAAIAGGLLGGGFVTRYGIFTGMWVLGSLQSLSNLSYFTVAMNPQAGSWTLYVASMIESFCAGLGTSAFLAFLMSICKKQFSGTQFALLSALFRISGIGAGFFSGVATAGIGYSAYFFLTFLISLPAFLFLGAVRKWIPQE